MKRQRRIETFFQSQREDRTYFYVDWSQRPYKAQWLTTKPKDVQFQEEVQWREMKLFITLGARLSTSPIMEHPAIKPDASLLSLVKSNLQKCVRRKMTQKALQTARFFMAMDMAHFIRRLFIIMLEDVVVHESVIALVWLTAAVNKGFYVTQEIGSWLLSIVSYLCSESSETYHSCRISNDTTQCTEENIKKFYSDSISEEHRPQSDILLTLLFRKAYGGMPGDLAMIMSFVELILRTGAKHIHTTPLDYSINGSDIPLIALEDINLCAVDFHCYPQIVLVLARENKDLSEKAIRTAIWQHSSRLNFRVKQYADDGRASKVLWFRIQRRVWSLQRSHIMVCRNLYTARQFQ